MKKLIYVHLDMISNSVLVKGLTTQEFYQTLTHLPKNLLLLNPASEDGEYEAHTALKVIRTPEKVQSYLQYTSRLRNREIEWVDFSDLHLLKQLTPVEISELLYFGHMKTHLHSPFFYKLQNNYAFLRINDEVTKVYYRYLDDFYQVLATSLANEVAERGSEKKGLFRRSSLQVSPLSIDVLKQLRPLLQEGVVFHLEKLTFQEGEYALPIYFVEDKVRNIEEIYYSDKMKMATLIYHVELKQWRVEMEEWDPLVNLHAL